jgi:hypothetical protein
MPSRSENVWDRRRSWSCYHKVLEVGGFEDESNIDCCTRDLFSGRRFRLDWRNKHGCRRSRLLRMPLRRQWMRRLLRLLPSSPPSPSLLWLLRRKRLRLLRCPGSMRCSGLCRSCSQLRRHGAGCPELRRCCTGCGSCHSGSEAAGSTGSAGSGS